MTEVVNDLLYLRSAEVIVGPKVETTNAPVEPVNARLFKTRINFEVNFDASGNANKAKIKIYNLSEESRTFLEQKNMVVFLNVGYESSGLTNLFFGDIDDKNGIHTERMGSDIITTIEAGDAEKILRRANIQIGLAAGATNLQVIEMASKKLNVGLSYKTNIEKLTYQNGFSYSGQVKNLMDEMASKSNFEWSIQNGELLILGRKETDKQEAILVSSNTGLIGFPTKTQDKVIFKMLLDPRVRPGRALRLESKIYLEENGANIKIDKANFMGDTDEGPWEVKVEGTAL